MDKALHLSPVRCRGFCLCLVEHRLPQVSANDHINIGRAVLIIWKDVKVISPLREAEEAVACDGSIDKFSGSYKPISGGALVVASRGQGCKTVYACFVG